jgi:glycosyltransferase involved in cell wall biosynthesis
MIQKKPLKIMFLINGSSLSPAGIRARMFAKYLPSHWIFNFSYRPPIKWKGIIQFIIAAIQFKPDIVYIMDTFYGGVIAAYFLKKVLRCKLVTDTGDVAYELAKSSGVYSQKQLALIKGIEQTAIRESDSFIVRGSYHKRLLVDQGISHVEFIPDGVEIESLPDHMDPSIKEQFGLEDSFIVGMIGNMAWSKRHQMAYGWDIIEALGMLKKDPVKALLIGDGDGQEILRTRAIELGVADRVIFAGRIPYDDLPKYIYTMDVCVSTQSNDLVGMVRTTGKLPLYLACGRYIIATDVGEAKRVLPNVGCLLPYEGVRDDQHPARLADHIQELLADPSRLQVSGKAQAVAKNNFDYRVLAKRVEKICLNLVNG